MLVRTADYNPLTPGGGGVREGDRGRGTERERGTHLLSLFLSPRVRGEDPFILLLNERPVEEEEQTGGRMSE